MNPLPFYRKARGSLVLHQDRTTLYLCQAKRRESRAAPLCALGVCVSIMLAVFRVRCSVCLLFYLLLFRERWAGLGMWAWGAERRAVSYISVKYECSVSRVRYH